MCGKGYFKGIVKNVCSKGSKRFVVRDCVGLSKCGTIKMWDYRDVGLSRCRTIDMSDYRDVGIKKPEKCINYQPEQIWNNYLKKYKYF